jgi:uncharacterized membrane protein
LRLLVDVDLLRALHVTGAVVLLGNVTITGFWAIFLYRVRRTVPFRSVARGILWADLLFTVTGGSLLTFSGILLLQARGLPFLETPWVLKGAASLALSTLLWLVFLLRDQFRLERLGPDDDDALRRIFLRWTIIGWTATGVLFYGLWSMVTRR